MGCLRSFLKTGPTLLFWLRWGSFYPKNINERGYLEVFCGDTDHGEKIEFQIIFTTAFGHFAIKAIKFSAFDYLLKPIDSGELKQTLQRLDAKLHKDHISLKIQTLLHNSEQETDDDKKIVLSNTQGLSFITISDVIRCQAAINYTHIFLKNGKKITASKTPKHFEKLLANHSFFRTHQSHLINLDCIDEYLKEGNTIVMTDKSQVEVSIRRKDAFLKKISS